MPLDMVSSRPLSSLARLSRPCAVKKLMALSSAELTFLPVAKFVCVVLIRFDVCCNCSRFERTPAERTILDIVRYLSGEYAVLAVRRVDRVDRQVSSHTPPNGP